MIILRKLFSLNKADDYRQKIIDRLKKDKIEDYDIIEEPPYDTISIEIDPEELKINIPSDQEYIRFEIEDFIRDEIKYYRVKVDSINRYLTVMRVRGLRPLTINEISNLVEFIINKYEFCSVIEEKNDDDY